MLALRQLSTAEEKHKFGDWSHFKFLVIKSETLYAAEYSTAVP